MVKLRDAVAPFIETAPVNIEAMIRSFGIELDKEGELDPEIAGQIEPIGGGKYKITTNATDHYYRRRFTMAHELAHWILHRDLIGSGVDDTPAFRSTAAGKFFNPNVRPMHETEANQMAAYLLMPSDLVRSEFAAAGGDVEALSKKFQVSKRSMEIRLRGLRLIP